MTYSRVSPVWRNTRIWKYLKDNADEVDLIFKPGFTGYKLAHPWITLILGAFRENVWFSQDDSGINYIGWLVDPLKLWNDHRESLMIKLNAQAATVNAPSFGNAFIMQPAIYFDQLTEMEFGTRVITLKLLKSSTPMKMESVSKDLIQVHIGCKQLI